MLCVPGVDSRVFGSLPTSLHSPTPLCLYSAPALSEFSQITGVWALASRVKPAQIDLKYFFKFCLYISLRLAFSNELELAEK